MTEIEFKEYIDEFKKLSLEKRKELTIKEIKEILTVISTLNNFQNQTESLVITTDIKKVTEEDSYSDYINAIFVYLHTIEESLATYLKSTLIGKED